MTIAWPSVPPALVALLPSLPGWSNVTVFNGEPVPNPPSDGRYFTVAYVNDEGSAGTFNQEVGSTDGLYEESGEVRCELALSVGESDAMTEVFADAMALLKALDARLRADRTLGGVFGPCTNLTLAADLLPIKQNGTAVRVPMSVQYFTETT